jgi:hypothetical protein
MAAPVGSLFSTHSVRIEEIISKNIEFFYPAMDPFFTKMVASNQGVGNAGEYGRDWKIRKTYMGSLTGVIDQGGPSGDFTLYGGANDTTLGQKTHLKGLEESWPDAFESPHASPIPLGIPMRSMLTNLPITLGELQAEVTPAFIGNVVAPKLEGFSKNIALTVAMFFYLSQNNFYRLSYLAGNSGTGWNATLDTNRELMVDTTFSNYAAERFFVGQRVQFFSSDGATLRQTPTLGTNTVFVVTRVNLNKGLVYFRALDNQAINGAGFANNDVIVFAKSKGNAATPYAQSPYFTGIAGLNSWIKTGSGSGLTWGSGDYVDNFLLGAEADGQNAISVVEHPEFASLSFNLAGAPVTEHFLRQVCRRWYMSKGRFGMDIDSFVAPDGVWLAYEAQLIGRQVEQRRGMLSTLKSGQGSDNGAMGDADILFVMDGKTFSGYTSVFAESGTIYGHKIRGGNWKRYTPPDPRGVRAGGNVPSWAPFRFVAPALTGTDSIQMPVYRTNGSGRTVPTEGAQMPGMLRMQVVPDQIPGIKITGAAEDRLYSV